MPPTIFFVLSSADVELSRNSRLPATATRITTERILRRGRQTCPPLCEPLLERTFSVRFPTTMTSVLRGPSLLRNLRADSAAPYAGMMTDDGTTCQVKSGTAIFASSLNTQLDGPVSRACCPTETNRIVLSPVTDVSDVTPRCPFELASDGTAPAFNVSRRQESIETGFNDGDCGQGRSGVQVSFE